ncbi:ankyrin repeat domain-containing protein 49 [Lingula anatina]|uniref:Ankyrin repeat domain-containing protein 49 n=1 Tax=Lingula anatina TaxID=7574 RepID=A0A1S3JK30_LINAN|nr:ankyrin repeat domain-containing protein 49 [Lingula anatina]XP_013410732.1 ankyrin repeat domain-containing protein 49 [Lingula anatina]XP_013410809.1 ankyrin repeat domain-containing protein 49 [Lingula anatina]|eukprot:XP_013410662.1 ankyrin repeat domain-containing protein 49 [Lingula anatina]
MAGNDPLKYANELESVLNLLKNDADLREMFKEGEVSQAFKEIARDPSAIPKYQENVKIQKLLKMMGDKIQGFATSVVAESDASATTASAQGDTVEQSEELAMDGESRDLFDEDAAVQPLVGVDVLEQILRAKKGDPSKFQSHWEQDEEDIDFATDEEIKNNPVQRILWAAENGEVDIVTELLQKDASLIQAVDKDGYTPLHRAAYNGEMDVVKILLSQGADVNAQTKDGWQPIHSAARWNQVEVVSLLLQNGGNINAQTNGGQTPLMLAASNREGKETTEFLLMNRYVDPHLMNNIGETAYTLCQRYTGFYYLFDIVHPSINSF